MVRGHFPPTPPAQKKKENARIMCCHGNAVFYTMFSLSSTVLNDYSINGANFHNSTWLTDAKDCQLQNRTVVVNLGNEEAKIST